MELRFALLMGAVLALQSPTVTRAAERGDEKSLQGTWVVSTAELAGKEAKQFKNATLEFKGKFSILTTILPSGRKDIDKLVFQLDEKSKPKRLTLYQEEDREKGVQRAIYESTGNKLKICMSPPGAKKYPSKFASKPAFLLLSFEKKSSQ